MSEASYSNMIEDLVDANHILYAQKVLDAYGHVSARHESNAGRFWLSRSLAPALVTAADVVTFDLDGQCVDRPSCQPYNELFIHSEIYRRRPDVKAIVHSHSPSVIPFGVTSVPLRAIFHVAGFLGTGIPVFDIRQFAGATDMLIRTAKLGAALTEILGEQPAVLLRGHGSVSVGKSLPQAVFRAYFLEVNARLQADAMRIGEVNFLTAEEAALAAASNDLSLFRPWELWKHELHK